MPIFEYICKNCDENFEVLIRGKTKPRCPACKSEKLEKQFSVPGVQGDGTNDKAMRAAKKRDQAMATDRMHDRLNYEKSHDRHGH